MFEYDLILSIDNSILKSLKARKLISDDDKIDTKSLDIKGVRDLDARSSDTSSLTIRSITRSLDTVNSNVPIQKIYVWYMSILLT